ncbi:GntR family transcriptional regulator [Allosalinactinospora lopnorensis]|uniref:GntR family transcriptional regulator n=1 Tax=Allosalinactinospora lopnorensis TaxID=1352348 RepID=UPI00069689CE|nr:GntR family transcriptional regulator [Allosalinactinospora lopnorensis]
MRLIGPQHSELWAEVFAELRKLIVLGELVPGQRLVEADLAQRLGVSRGPVRTALSELARVGLVELSSRRSARVVSLTTKDVAEIYTVRSVLERLSLQTADHEDVRAMLPELSEDLDALEMALDEGDRSSATEADLAFHRNIASIAGNGRLLAAWDMQADQVRLVIGWVQRHDPTVAAKSGEHRAVLEALQNGDCDRACAALEKHLAASEAVMRAGAARLWSQSGRSPTEEGHP